MVSLLRMAVMVLLAGSAAVNAATMDITASFTPSMSNPENNTFTNTTPQSGYCVAFPAQCSETNVFSIAFPITTTLTAAGFQPGADPRNGMYFKMPGAWRSIQVVNEEGQSTDISFRINAYSAEYRTINDWSWAEHREAWGTDFVNVPSPCTYSGVGYYGYKYYGFIWKWPIGDQACYRVSRIELVGEPYRVDNMSIGYEIKTPDPLKMASGIYKGSVTLSVGPGGDFDFGDNFQASDSNLTINFTLSVNHELQLTTSPEDRQVSLQPCSPGRVCTEEEGKANWERWMVNRVTPQLTGRSNFSLSSSGAFTVFLQCEQQLGQDCALQSENAAQQVPVQALLTLPDNIVDQNTNATVSRRKLLVGKDAAQNIFNTKSFGQDRKGSIDFVVAQKDVDTMLKTRPDTYKGTITVIFDPVIY